ncbi:MAG: LLM class flavin-dependent oxidoreductase [Chloroflexi bacterium]|nr:LLM class flavin-dependent oxidoreductase [Chloroflexota bacterium]
MEFGFCIPCFANPGAAFFRTPAWTALDPVAAVEAGVLAEALGYDSLWMADHLIHGADGGILEGWTTLSVLAGRTRRVQLGTIHLAHPFRQPAVTAKMAATLDALSGGRLIFFYDAGWGRAEIDAYGLPFPDEAERVARMDEGLALIKQLWTGEPVDFRGRFYQTQAAICRPAPAQQPRPPIWLGEARGGDYLAAVARHADGWNSTPAAPAGYADKWAQVAAACAAAGRDADALTRSLEIQVLVGPTRSAVREQLRHIAALPLSPRVPADPAVASHVRDAPLDAPPLPAAVGDRWLIGTPDEVVEQITAFEMLGVSHLMLWFVDFPSTDGLRLFSEAVMPHWRR